MSVLEMSDELAEQENDCCCDFVQRIVDEDETFELHHGIPDDGAPHVTDVECGCNPDIERVEHDLIVVDHRDQDIDLALDGEEDPWSSSVGSTGAAPAPSAPGSC